MESTSPVLNTNEKKLLTLILATSFLIKLILALFLQAPIRSDSSDYLTLASSLLNGEYMLDGKPTAYVGCGYPLFLALIMSVSGEGQFYIRVIQSLIEIGTGYFFFGVCRNFFNVRYSLIALAVFCFFPSNIIFSQAVLSESLFGFFSTLILYLLLKNNFPEKLPLIFVTGVLFGYAVLIRTAFLPAALLVPIYFFYFRKDLYKNNIKNNFVKASMVFLFGVILVLAPWSIRNKIAVNTFSLGTTTGLNFWAGSNPDATGTYYTSMNDNLPIDFTNEPERDKEYIKLGLKYVMENPLRYLVLGVKKMGYLFSSERMAILYFVEHTSGETSTQVYKKVNPLIILIVNLPYYVVMLLGTWGLLMLNKKKFFIYGFIFAWMGTVFVFIALARYHYVLVPFFIIGCVNFFVQRNHLVELSLFKKITGISFSLFLIAVWSAEIYLLIK